MNIILDTHILLWFLSGDKNLKSKDKFLIADNANNKFVSLASIWEIALKVNTGKLDLGISLAELVEEIATNNFQFLEIEFKHIYHLSELPFHHSDPFDRIIIAQAVVEDFKLLTVDIKMKKYKVEIL
jgi:PIN domain nuclease of toxin-antitoxin system